jgi:hypothetical protein
MSPVGRLHEPIGYRRLSLSKIAQLFRRVINTYSINGSAPGTIGSRAHWLTDTITFGEML